MKLGFRISPMKGDFVLFYENYFFGVIVFENFMLQNIIN